EAAYTLVEAVVAVTLFTLVAGVVLSLYLVSVRGVARWQEGLALENTLHVVRTRVAEDLRRAERVERGAEGALLLGFADGTAVTYTQRDSTLFRGERLLI